MTIQTSLRQLVVAIDLRQRHNHSTTVDSAEHALVHLALLIWEDQIQSDSYHGGNDERSLNDQVDALQESRKADIRSVVVQHLVEPRRCNNVDEAYTKGDSQDEATPSGELYHS